MYVFNLLLQNNFHIFLIIIFLLSLHESYYIIQIFFLIPICNSKRKVKELHRKCLVRTCNIRKLSIWRYFFTCDQLTNIKMKHKLESRLPGEISIISDMQMTPPLWQKVIQWPWVWVNSDSWWWTGRPCMLQSWVRKESDMTERLNWTEIMSLPKLFELFSNNVVLLALMHYRENHQLPTPFSHLLRKIYFVVVAKLAIPTGTS